MTDKNKGLPSRQNLIDAISRADLYSFVQRGFRIRIGRGARFSLTGMLRPSHTRSPASCAVRSSV